MVAIGSVLYFLVLGLALYVMDRQVYTAEKMEIIRNNFLEIFNPPASLNDEARRALYGFPVDERPQEQQRLRKSLEEIVNGPSSIYKMWLADEAGNILVEAENPAKPETYNSWNNNLFIREFSGRTSQNVTPSRFATDEKSTAAGHLIGIYTSPTNLPAITKLTKKYRVYAAGLSIAWLLAWMVIYYYLLRPVRNVTLQLDRSTGAPPALIHNARGALEQGYNELAASALLQMIEETLNRAARVGEVRSSRSMAIDRALRLTGEGFLVRGLRVAILSSGEMPTEIHEWWATSSEAFPQKIQSEELPGAASNATPAESADTEIDTTFTLFPDNSGFTWCAPLASGLVQIDCLFLPGAHPSARFQEYLIRACESLRAGFVAFQAYREQLFRERSEANISLSRNMGHDLTNIIATSKLELLGIKRILQATSEGVALSGQRAAILSQSVSGLLDSTRLMQEMVNIYRSFSYVKRPAYERRALAPLIEEFLQMFEPALSSRMAIQRELPPDTPAPIVEPRLLKLALFNVLQNALDALKRSPESAEPGSIKVTLEYDADAERYEISVSDSGPGIRDAAGDLLSAQQIMTIFDYGYSTKGLAGEGLGLNWVQTIMTDFHDGGVRAANNANGAGATVTLWLQSMERKEARVGNGDSGIASAPNDNMSAMEPSR